MRSREVAVTGLGLVTPAGVGVAESWATICAGTPTAAADPRLAGLAVDFSCAVAGFDPEALLGAKLAWRMDRYMQFALVAAGEAVVDSGLDPAVWDGARVAVVCGTAHGGTYAHEDNHRRYLDGTLKVSALTVPMMLPNMAAGELAIRYRALGPNLSPAMGCATGTSAIGQGRSLILSGAADVVLAGASEAAVSPFAVTCLDRMNALSGKSADPAAASRPFDADRDGFVIAEGAAVLVLESLSHARGRGARIRALLAGYGAAADGHHVTAPHPDGAGLVRAVEAALADTGHAGSVVDHVNAHGTGTRLNDTIEARVLHRTVGPDAAVTSVKGCIGHTLGAAGAIEAAVTVLSVQHGLIPPTANLTVQDPQIDLDVVRDTARRADVRAALSTSSGFGGQNAALVFTPA
ncbi:beta-ketoacyl-[acyl-carrier-protein] synthase family protein [Streptomyces sp. NPDC020799]|uniref:beta-ketoacyl-[acyl-carrier-protein] synthase family protein n=1 Tax=Streptomyces sp. NPDC020799 TaxID=3365091 RepID=UPI00379B18D3